MGGYGVGIGAYPVPNVPVPTYDVIITNDGTNIYATTKTGTILSQGAASLYTANVQIQAANDYLTTGGTIYIARGAYGIKVVVTLSSGVGVICDNNAVFTAKADCDMIAMGINNQWQGGQFACGGAAGNYTKSVFTVVDFDYASLGGNFYSQQRYIRDVSIMITTNSAAFSGKAIYFNAEKTGGATYAIADYTLENIKITCNTLMGYSYAFEYGIHFRQYSNNTNLCWFNACRILNCFVANCKYGIYLECADTTNANFCGHVIKDTTIQARASAGSVYGVYCEGQFCYIDVIVWDLSYASPNQVCLGAKSSYCIVRSNVGYGNSGTANVLETGAWEKYGVAAAKSDAGTIAHGLGVAPTYWTVKGTVDGESVTATADATNLTLAIKKLVLSEGTPNTMAWSAGTAQDIMWYARK